MKLRNKKTEEMGIVSHFDNQSIVIYPIDENWNAKGDKKYVYASLAELNEEWEDCEDKYYGITHFGQVREIGNEYEKMREDMEQIGNYFETKEEAEKAVAKLKAWKRLKDKGFKFKGLEVTYLDMDCIEFDIGSEYLRERDLRGSELNRDLDLLFGGEE